MEIVKFKKNKDNTYLVIFDNDLSLLLYDDVIIKYNLLVNKNLTDSLLEKITNYNDFLKGYYKAVKYIMKKLRSEKEVKVYLEKLEISEEEQKKVINKLKKDGYINEANYIKSYINDQINLTLNGPEKIRYSLKKLGFSLDDINNYLVNFNNLWYERIDKLVEQKIKSNKNLGKNKLKLKIINDLVNKGYQKYDIINVLNEKEIDVQSILLKEYQKAYNKYKTKYNNQVNAKVKDVLYKKGFDLSDIERVIQTHEEV